MHVNRTVIHEFNDVIGPSHLSDLTVDPIVNRKRVIDSGDSSALALVDLKQAFSFRIEAKVHVSIDHNRGGLRQIEQS